jgi:hypothetical protein
VLLLLIKPFAVVVIPPLLLKQLLQPETVH